jgi:hypothetical protein
MIIRKDQMRVLDLAYRNSLTEQWVSKLMTKFPNSAGKVGTAGVQKGIREDLTAAKFLGIDSAEDEWSLCSLRYQVTPETPTLRRNSAYFILRNLSWPPAKRFQLIERLILPPQNLLSRE